MPAASLELLACRRAPVLRRQRPRFCTGRSYGCAGSFRTAQAGYGCHWLRAPSPGELCGRRGWLPFVRGGPRCTAKTVMFMAVALLACAADGASRPVPAREPARDRGGVAGLGDGLAAGVGGAQRDGGGGEKEGRAGQQRAVEARRERGVCLGVGGEQRAGAGGRDGGEDRQAEGGAQLLGGVQQAAASPALSSGTPALAAVVTATRTAPIPIAMSTSPGSRLAG